MASSKGYLQFVLDQLSELEDVSHRAMMGEYLLYYRGKVFGGIYDDRLLIKPTGSVLALTPNPRMELPYAGAKELLLVENVEDREYLCQLVQAMYEELPAPKKR